MGRIKNRLKKTKIYQYKKCRDEFDRIKSRTPAITGKMHPIFTCKTKLTQIEKVLTLSKLDVSCKYGFFYSIDETIIPFSYNKLVDNMPFDYSVVLEKSLTELKERNPQLIELLIGYVYTVTSQVADTEIRQRLLDMINGHPQTLKYALQRILFWNQLLWQTGHKLIGLSRLDKLLAPYELDEAVLSDFLQVLHMHYNFKSSAMVGDTGQIIILGGKEPDGSYFENDYTKAFIHVLGGLDLPDPKILLRVSSVMPKELLRLACTCIATGCGSPLLSNDDVVIPALKEFGYEDDAYNYAVSACWEPLVIGKSLEQNNLYDIEFGAIFGEILQNNSDTMDSFEELFMQYKKALKSHLGSLCRKMDSVTFEENPIMSIATEGCWERHLDISKGGAKYNNYGLLSVGLASAVDSLLNFKRYVYEKQTYTYAQIRDAILHDYEGNERLKADFSQKLDGFGTNSPEAVELTNEIMAYTSDVLASYRNRFGGSVKFGLSSPAYVNGGKRALATADGRCSGEPFATHISRSKPQPLTDIIGFAGSLRYGGNKSNGNVVDMIVQPSLLRDNFEQFVLFVKAAITVGFFQIQFNVLTYEQLIEAKKHPEKYPNLIVRVWGFSAYFNDLPEAYKDVLIARAKEGMAS